jgi:hypothetical protein
LKEVSSEGDDYAVFDMPGVHGGTYLVSVTRPGYLTWYKKITLDDDALDLGSVALLAGDVNSDGLINAADSNALTALYGKEYGQSGYNIAADLNGDKVIDSSDLALLTPNLSKNSNIYAQNVNCITVAAAKSGDVLTVSGTAKPSGQVRVTVVRSGLEIISDVVTANSSGVYSAACNMSAGGTYTITVTADDRAVDAKTSITY